MKTRLLIAVLMAITLAACSSNRAKPIPIEPDVVTVVEFRVTECPSEPSTPPVSLLPVFWGTGEDADGDTVFTLTPAMYENLSKNMADIIGGLEGKNLVIKYYKVCLADAKEVAERSAPPQP